MKCTECGATMKVRKESYRYDESGLKHVTLVGVEVVRCPRCDNYEISIPHIEELHRLIAKILIEKSTRFTGDEVRFLRKSLGWSGTDFAKHMGVAEETVSRGPYRAAGGPVAAFPGCPGEVDDQLPDRAAQGDQLEQGNCHQAETRHEKGTLDGSSRIACL
jgi:putative zinc finger/helix-turn-helix YgiT family protein